MIVAPFHSRNGGRIQITSAHVYAIAIVGQSRRKKGGSTCSRSRNSVTIVALDRAPGSVRSDGLVKDSFRASFSGILDGIQLSIADTELSRWAINRRALVRAALDSHGLSVPGALIVPTTPT